MAKQTSKNKSAKTRRLKERQYRSFRLNKRIKPLDAVTLPSAWLLLKDTARHLWQFKRVFAGILGVYALLVLVFVWAGGSLLNASDLKATLNDSLGLSGNSIMANVTVFSILLGSAAAGSSDVASTYQSIILLVISLALVWTWRNTSLEVAKTVRVRDSFYKGMAPLVPFLLVLLVVGLQLLPMLIASVIFNIVLANGLAATAIEQALWLLLFLASAVLSLYMISSSIFALFVVTLPNMTPMRALKSARKLVKYRRWVIMRKLIAASLLLFVAFSLTVILAIYVVPSIAQWVFFAGTLVVLPLTLGFIYKLYRALL